MQAPRACWPARHGAADAAAAAVCGTCVMGSRCCRLRCCCWYARVLRVAGAAGAGAAAAAAASIAAVLLLLLPPPHCRVLHAAAVAHRALRAPPAHPCTHPPSTHPTPPEFCKQQLWPILHYLVPLSPTSLGRFDPALWSAYVRANMAFANKLVEVGAAAFSGRCKA